MAEVMDGIVRFLTGTNFGDIPPATVGYAKKLCLSQLAAVVGGVQMPVSKIVAQRARHQGGATEAGVAGHGFKAPVAEAALCNAVFAHATELEDDALAHPDRTTIGTVIPAIFTLGQALKSTGPEVLESMIVGFDVHAKTAVAARSPSPHSKGSMAFTTGGWGPAASAAKLLKLDAQRTRMTMGLAASMVGGLLHQVPTMMHFLESGIAARDGILAALWAKDGITANPDIIEVADGFWDLTGAEDTGLELLKELLAGELRLMRVGIKKYGCAYLMQRIVDGAIDLRREARISYENIAHVELHVAPWFDEFKHFYPQTVDAARFSMSHVLAGILLGEPTDLRTFSEAAIRDPRYAEAQKKIELRFHPERGLVRFDKPDELIIRMKDGTVHRKMCDVARGSPPHYLTEEEVIHKFTSCAQFSHYLSPTAIERVCELCLNLEKVQDVGEIMDLLAAG